MSAWRSAAPAPTSPPRPATWCFMGDPLHPLPLLAAAVARDRSHHPAEHLHLRLRRQCRRHRPHGLAVAAAGAAAVVRAIARRRRRSIINSARWPCCSMPCVCSGSSARATSPLIPAHAPAVCSRVNDWLEHRFDLEEGVHWLSHQWKPVLGRRWCSADWCGWRLSGLNAIAPMRSAWCAVSAGRCRRISIPVCTGAGRGPSRRVTRVQPHRIHTVEIGFRSLFPATRAGTEHASWSSSHVNEGVRRMPEEAVMITGDGNLIELQGTLRYTIADPRALSFRNRRSRRHSAQRRRVGAARDGGRPHVRRLVDQRAPAAFRRRPCERLNGTLRRLRRQRHGHRLEGLDLHDLHPPQDVVGAYHDVTRAMERRDLLVNQGEEKVLRDERQGNRPRE